MRDSKKSGARGKASLGKGARHGTGAKGLLPEGMDILPPSDDRIFKLLLTSPDAKPVLMDLISSIIGRRVKDVVIRNNELPKDGTGEKAERLDVNCGLDDGTQIDLEMQASRVLEERGGRHDNLNGKTVYYLCDLHSSQSAKGVKRYDRLAKTYQVTFTSYTVFPEREGFANSFSLRHDGDNGLLSDAIRVVYVELSKLEKVMKKDAGGMTDLEKWAVFLRYAAEPGCRGIVNKVIASKEELKMAAKILMSVSQDERERAVLRSRKMYQTDMMSNFATAEDRGKKQGEKIGEKRGKKIGKKIGERIGSIKTAKEIAREMMLAGEPVEKISRFTRLSRNEINSLAQQ
ncbi:MAG: Rpn family recombination-promoting nuclease/putative transposase [Lachnospiraceae bacterium]|nr:Rpn family recombination-promoting nuclease/putative transposase [Lachnospiraceae bacterium]